jgi:hypothetical protein
VSDVRETSFTIRVRRLPTGAIVVDNLVVTKHGTACVETLEKPAGTITPSEIHGIIHSLHDALQSHLTMTSGVQLTLDGEERPHWAS